MDILKETVTNAVLFAVGEITKRVLKLIEIDSEIRNNADEDDFDLWVSCGIPDETVLKKDYDTLIEIATDEDEYFEMIGLSMSIQNRF